MGAAGGSVLHEHEGGAVRGLMRGLMRGFVKERDQGRGQGGGQGGGLWWSRGRKEWNGGMDGREEWRRLKAGAAWPPGAILCDLSRSVSTWCAYESYMYLTDLNINNASSTLTCTLSTSPLTHPTNSLKRDQLNPTQ